MNRHAWKRVEKKHSTREITGIMAKGVKKENLYVIHTKGDSEMSNNRLGIDNEIYIKNHTAIDTIINKANKRKGLSYFCRKKRYTLYYLGREILTIWEKDDKSISIKLRSEFSGEKELPMRLNKTYRDKFEGIMSSFKESEDKGYFSYTKTKSNKQIILKKHKFSYHKLFKEILPLLCGLLDEYYKDKPKNELQIQGAYCALYKDLNNLDNCGGLWIFDMEYNDINKNGLTKEEKEKSEIIDGRFDMIALKRGKDAEKPYELIFIELKCKRQAIRLAESGLLSHIDDMNDFLKNYRNDATGTRQNLREQVENCIKKFYYLGKKKGKTYEAIEKLERDAEYKYFDKINYNKPQYWVLFDMQYESNGKKETIKTLDDISKMSLYKQKSEKRKYENLRDYQEMIDNINTRFFAADVSKEQREEIFWAET